VTWATIHGPFGHRRFVDADFEWAVKAAHHEPGDTPCRSFEQLAVLWAMANRWASGKSRAESFGVLLKNYCQPINVNQIGKVHTYDRTPADPEGLVRSAERDARIRANIARPLDWYVANAPETVGLVARFMRGLLPVPRSMIGVVDFAARFVMHGAPWIEAEIPELQRCSGAERFWKMPWSAGWSAGTVRIGGRGVGYVGPVALLVVVAGGSWWYLRQKSRRVVRRRQR